MSIIFAVPRLYEAVAARFTTDDVQIPMYFGWKEVSQQVREPTRIVWVPGDFGGSLGKIGPPKYPGKGQLLTLYELVTIHITAADATVTTNPDGSSSHALADSMRQYQRAREVHDLFLRAVHLAAVGTYSVIADQWKGMHEDEMRRWGASIQLVLEVQAPITDEPSAYESLQLDAAELDAIELDHVEIIRVDRQP